jgi:hypothetical protein
MIVYMEMLSPPSFLDKTLSFLCLSGQSLQKS